MDAAIAKEVLRVVQPMAVETSLEAERLYAEARHERQRVAGLDLQKARYEARLAERRYAACDPNNRLIAAELEKSWEAALQRVQAYEARLRAMPSTDTQADTPDLTGLAGDLKLAWYAPGVTARARQRLVRTLTLTLSSTSTMTRAMSPLRSIGKVASTLSFGSRSPSPVSTAAKRPTKRWR